MTDRTSSHRRISNSLARRGFVALAALLFGLGFGLNFGVSNENTYLLGGLRLLHPEMLAHDWLATQTTPYHRLFAYPVAALLYLDASGWLFAAVNVMLLTVGAVIVFKLIESVIAAPARSPVAGGPPLVPSAQPLAFAKPLLALVLVLLVNLATHSLSVADSTLYTLAFEPATLGVTGFLLGMYLFARERYLLSGAAVAAGGVFHANYLILSFPVFLLAHLVLRRRGVLRPLLRQFAVPVVALAALLPIIIPIALHPGSSGTDILLSIRSPHHYRPLTFRDEFVPLLGWILLFGAGLRRRDVQRGRVSPTVALAAAMVALIVLATALTTFVYIPSVAQMYVWRLAPLAVLLAQMYAVRMVTGAAAPAAPAARPAPATAEPSPAGAPGAAPATEPEPGSHWLLPAMWRTCLVLVAAECFASYYYLWHRDWLVVGVLCGVALLGILAWAARWRGAPAALRPGSGAAVCARSALVVAMLATAALAYVSANGLTDNSSLLAAATPESQLYSWARTATDPGAIFLIPPDMDDFRFSSQRAVVVDWKSTPFIPGELEEWYRRIDAVAGGSRPQRLTQAAEGFAKLNGSALAALADRYAAAYVVQRYPTASTSPASTSPASAPPAPWEVVFDNGRYRVLRTGVNYGALRSARLCSEPAVASPAS